VPPDHRQLGEAVGDEVDDVETRDFLRVQQIDGVRLLLAEDGHQDIGAPHFASCRDCTWNTARCNTRWNPSVGCVSRCPLPSGITGVVASTNSSQVVRRLAISAPQASSTRMATADFVVQQCQQQMLDRHELMTFLALASSEGDCSACTSRSLLSILMVHGKEFLQHLNDEIHRGVVVIQQDDLVQRRALELGLGLLEGQAVAGGMTLLSLFHDAPIIS
jgi:hypothetical protein